MDDWRDIETIPKWRSVEFKSLMGAIGISKTDREPEVFKSNSGPTKKFNGARVCRMKNYMVATAWRPVKKLS